MLKKITVKLLAIIAVVTILHSCSDKEDTIVDLRKSELIFTAVTGPEVIPHGDHFHGLDNGVSGASIVLTFDKNGNKTNNGKLKIKADVAYKVDLKTWDKDGKEIQQDFIKNKEIADAFKAFLIGGNLKMNADSETEQGALFQPREKKYGNDSDVSGKYEVTGILSYFTLGKENLTKSPLKVSYVLRKLNDGMKGKIERNDWNRSDYKTAFAGENVLELHFEIEAD